ncbi:MAG: hypothetical protein ABI772_15690, partial [Bacteroidota bacterium]
LDSYSLKSSGKDWISLDFRGLFIGSYLLFLGIHITISTIAVVYYHHFKLFPIHFYTAIISLVIICIGLFTYDKIEKAGSLKKNIAKTEQRKSIYNQIQLKRWWLLPDATNPKIIYADLEVTSAGRFAALVNGKEDGESGKTIFTSDGEAQRLVKGGEHIHYEFPLTIINPGEARVIEFTFYLFKAPVGQSSVEDVVKIYKDFIITNDDGSYFYEKLMPPLSEAPE